MQIEFTEAKYGLNQPDVASLWAQVCANYIRLGDMEEAYNAMTHTVHIRQHAHGVKPGVLATTLQKASTMAEKAGHIEDALAYLEQARDEFRRTGVKERAALSDMDYEQGKLLLRLKRYSEASESFANSQRIREAEYGPDHPKS